MPSQIKLYACAVFVALAINPLSFLQIRTQSSNIPIPSVIEFALQRDEFSEIPSSRPTTEVPRLGSALSIEALLTEIANWLSENFDLPPAGDKPRVEFASRMKLATMRERGLSPDEGREDITTSTMQSATEREVVALYYDPTRTIYLSTDWTGANLADVSVLVHEMVHHLQNLGGLKFECPAAREKIAYLAQDQWLQLHGSSLEKDFEIDKFTVMINSACLS